MLGVADSSQNHLSLMTDELTAKNKVDSSHLTTNLIENVL